MYSYDRSTASNDYDRTAASSATPGLDTVVRKDHSSKLKAATGKAMRAADKAEDFLKKGHQGKWTADVKSKALAGLKKAADEAVKAAYSMLNTLRPALSSKELAAIKGMDIDVAKQGKMLIESLLKLDGEHYGPLASMRVTDENVNEIPGILHKLSMQMDTVEKVYKQFRAAY